jgi:hypothetical protein
MNLQPTEKEKAMTTMTKTTTTTTTEMVAVLDSSVEELIVEFNEAKAAIKEAEAKKAAAEAQIRELLGGSDVGMIDGVERIRVQHRNMTKIDRELLKTAFPEAHEATMIASSYTVLQTK